MDIASILTAITFTAIFCAVLAAGVAARAAFGAATAEILLVAALFKLSTVSHAPIYDAWARIVGCRGILRRPSREV